MYDSGKIGLGLIFFIALVTFPFWVSIGGNKQMPELKMPDSAHECVESKEFMRTNHMRLLNQWRDSVVRENNYIYVSSTGKSYVKSLTKTCLNCHSSKEEFCERCHTYASVRPYCWSCHLESE
ncbi:MAG: sulfate reduction electron transfer complex DsrMKJOP subunit DsrJ [SAR324 cluster bacterium]|nr:sulfate reduction electron transfer complex DsrMKJOP subunit DsrJ [SAR324 cluster bacterium]